MPLGEYDGQVGGEGRSEQPVSMASAFFLLCFLPLTAVALTYLAVVMLFTWLLGIL